MNRDCWATEQIFWTGSAAEAIRRLDEAAVMVFAPTGILQGRAIASRLGGAPRWDSIVMDQRHVTESDDVTILAYRATAMREGITYRAFCSSTWIRRDDGWRLIAHQQTPL